MVRVECVATQEFVTFTSMPLLTELFSIKDGFSYKRGAPNGAVITSLYRIPLETAKRRLCSKSELAFGLKRFLKCFLHRVQPRGQFDRCVCMPARELQLALVVLHLHLHELQPMRR